MTKKEQYIIDFPLEASYREADFVVSESNLESYNFLRDPNLWNNFCLVLTGEEGAGKTHLSHIWSEWFSAQKLSPLDLTLDETKTYFIVENLDLWIEDREREEFLFHLYNHCFLEQKKLLITSSIALTDFSFSIPDLRSRLMGAATSTIKSPDDYLLLTVFFKLCSDYQLSVDEAVAHYILMRAERSLSYLKTVVGLLNKKALSEKRKVTIPLAKEVLEKDLQNKMSENES